ncbi:MAG TPA: hypothetical protein VGE01_10590 [Fimbriimonas sp.]
MTSLVAALLLTQGSPEATLQVVVGLPELSPSETSTLGLITRVAPRMTEDYSQRDILQLTSGRPVVMQLMPDHVRLSISVDGSESLSTVGIAESILRRAVMRQEDIDSDRGGPIDDWISAILAPRPASASKRRADVLALYRRVFRAGSLHLFTGGSADTARISEEWNRRLDTWVEPRTRARARASEPTTNPRRTAGFSTVTLVGKTIPARDPALPTRILALVALGVGKAGSLHRVWREKNGWSYRQEAVLLPVQAGWQPQLVAAMDPANAATARDALREDVAAWTERDRDRALGAAEGAFVHWTLPSPLYLGSGGTLENNLADRTYLAGFWRWKTHTPWDPPRLVELMSMIKLGELKETALEIVNGSSLRILPE